MKWFQNGLGKRDAMMAQETAFQPLQAVRAYWEGLRRADQLPRRDQIDPRGIAMALDCVFLIEQIAPGHARIRLAGMHLCDLLGMDVRGMPVTSLLEPVARDRLSAALPALFRGESLIEIGLEAERGIGRPTLEARMVLLPLLGEPSEPRLALGCLCSAGDIGRAPRRFAIARLMHQPLAQPARQTAFAEAQTPFAPARGRPHLRLVSSREG